MASCRPEGFIGCIETQPVPDKYFLNQNAAVGILRQADQIGRNLPAYFRRSLERAAAAFSHLWQLSKGPDENRWDFEPGKGYRKLKLASCLYERAL